MVDNRILIYDAVKPNHGTNKWFKTAGTFLKYTLSKQANISCVSPLTINSNISYPTVTPHQIFNYCKLNEFFITARIISINHGQKDIPLTLYISIEKSLVYTSISATIGPLSKNWRQTPQTDRYAKSWNPSASRFPGQNFRLLGKSKPPSRMSKSLPISTLFPLALLGCRQIV
jgi:hypothetical protein